MDISPGVSSGNADEYLGILIGEVVAVEVLGVDRV